MGTPKENISLGFSWVVGKLNILKGLIPTRTSDLTNDGEDTFSPFVQQDGLKTVNGNSLIGSGNLVINGQSVIPDYLTITALTTDQANQTAGVGYWVDDASADPDLTFPAGETRLQAYYRYLGTTNGTMADYELISAPYGNHTAEQLTTDELAGIQNANGLSAANPVATMGDLAIKQTIKTGNFPLVAADNDNTISMDGGICTINPNTQTYQDAYVVAMKNITDATDGSIVCTAATGWTYKVNDAATVTDGTFTFPAGATCTIVKFEGTNKIYIDGGVE